MITRAVFALNQGEVDQYILNNHLEPDEVLFIDSEADADSITDPKVEVVMIGQYYERPQWYTELADRLERRLNYGGERTDRAGAVPGFADGGEEEADDAGEPSETDLPAEREDGQGQQSVEPGNVAEPAQRPNLPRRKSDEAKEKN